MSILNRSYSSSGAGRAIGTTFQNTSATYPLIVIADCDSNGTWGTFSGDIGPTSGLGTNIFSETPSNAGVTIWDTCFFMVPPLWFYKVSGAAHLTFWTEYEILTGTLSGGTDLGPSGSSTRALATNYTNSGTNGIIALVVINTIPANADCQGFTNGNMTYQVNNDNGGYATQTVKLFVPAGQTYQVACATATIQTWREYDIGCTFTDPGDQTANFTIGAASATQNTGTQPWLITVPVINNASTASGHTFSLLSDSSNPPTTTEMQQSLRRAFSPIAHSTVFGVVMPSEYALITDDTGASNVGSARLYSLGGIPFASKPLMTYQNP